MSIQSQITRIRTNIQNTISIVAGSWVTVPDDATSDSLPALVDELANGDFDCGLFTDAVQTGAMDCGEF